MQKAYRYRLYPTDEQGQQMTRIIGCCTDEQGQQMTRIIGCCRFVWNRLLEYCSKSYTRRKENHTAYDLNNFIAHSLKPAFPWFSDAPAQTLQCVSADLSAAFKAFFRKDAAYPKFKTKHRSKKSFRIPQKGKVDVERSRIYVQGIGWVEAVIHRKPIGKLKNITVTVNPSGTVYASCLFDDGLEAPVPELPEKPKVIGIDLNLERLAVCSDGTDYENPRTLKQYEKRLRHLQKLLSKKKKGSGNWKKLRHEIAVLHEKISNTRKNSIHKMTKKIVCDSQADVMVIEDLNVSGMVKNHKLSKHIQDASFFEIRRQLEYKSLFYGKTLITADRFFASSRTCTADRFFASSRTCHICGWHNAELTLSDREWECKVCHTRQDRDRNAALNLESFGLKALAGDAGEVKPPEMLSVDGRAEMHLRGMASGNEEKNMDTPWKPSGLPEWYRHLWCTHLHLRYSLNPLCFLQLP